MYDARVFYNKKTGVVLEHSIIYEGVFWTVEEELKGVAEMTGLSLNDIGFMFWDTPDNELEREINVSGSIFIDISKTPHIVCAVPLPAPSEDDEISGSEFLSMVEEVV